MTAPFRSRPWLLVLLGASIPLTLGALGVPLPGVERQPFEGRGFVTELEVSLAAPPAAVYDALTGDVSAWWDHTFFENPRELRIEDKAGGGFWELLDEEGHGVQHATVTWAEPGKKLVLRGPFGLHGRAADLVASLVLEGEGERTLLTASIHVFGELTEGLDPIVENVWHHFLVERLKPHVEGDLEGG